MAETYCGKTCEGCYWKAQLHCAGCMDGPGRQYGGDCELARCCREKGHEVCDTCLKKKTCNTLIGRFAIPEYRLKNRDAEQKQDNAVFERAILLNKWLWPLFWLFIPSSIAGLFVSRNIAGTIPHLYMAGILIRIVCSIFYGYFLLRLTKADTRYRTAGICVLIPVAVDILEVIFFGTEETPLWWLLVSIPFAALSVYGTYNEFNAHSAVLVGVNGPLSEKWDKLRSWFIGCYAAMLGCSVLMFIIPILSLIVLFAAIATFVIAIIKLVYLYNTATTFKNCVIRHQKELLDRSY